jgi:2-polyprenyl-3-methyl-5-hydroxy-6-metoxy-1,4-benzoquinol methylase
MRERAQCPDPAIDREEEAWWNANAETVEAIWAMAAPVRRALRTPYLERARRFFLEGRGAGPVTLLEIGCGSGWVGRMIAERRRLHVIGIDLAAEQIRLAEDNAAREGLRDVCQYRCQNLSDFAARDAQAVSCVLIHAILHHLSWQEIRSVLGQLRALGPGTRLFVYEPAYLADPATPIEPSPRARRAQRAASLPARATELFRSLLRPARDEPLLGRVKALVADAQRQGRILSPKEVVFREPELLALLGEIGEVTERFLCDFTSVAASQFATTLRSARLQRGYCRTILPLAAWIDRRLFARGEIPLVTRDYVFMGYHCTIR